MLVIGPLPPPISGVSLANRIVCEYLPLKYKELRVSFINNSFPTFKEDLGSFSWKKVLFYLKQYKLLKVLRNDILYLTPGQTFFGVIKYFPFIGLAALLKKHIIIHIHGNYVHQEFVRLDALRKRLYHYILSRATKGIVLSPTLKKNLSPFIAEDSIYILFNFVEDYLLDIDIKNKIRTNFSSLKILYLSNLMEEKGIFDFFEALQILKNNKIPFSATIAGGIDPKLQAQISKKFDELNNFISYRGIVSGEEKKEILVNANIFVFPTYYRMEGQPIVLLEAMATGNIILTTEHAGIPDIFKENKNGFFIKKRSPVDIAEKLSRLSSHLSIYKNIAMNNHIEATRKYTVDQFISNLHEIIES